MARPRAVTDHDLLDRLAGVFRTAGYDGASVTMLSEAAGLRSASLYHRFPDGKVGMATAILEDVERQFDDVLGPLNSAAEPRDGVLEMTRRIAAFYADGRLSCLLETMTLDGSPPEVTRRASDLARGWIRAMAGAAARAGADEDEAVRRARDAFVRIEGALVLARVLDDPSEFLHTLELLPDLLIGPRA